MWKVAASLLALAALLSAVWMGHGAVTGIGVPYQDTTPDQAAYVLYHWGISERLFLATGVAWLVAGIVTTACTGHWLFKGRHGAPRGRPTPPDRVP